MKRILIAVLLLPVCIVLVSCGIGTPNLLGMTVGEATEALETADLSMGKVDYDEGSEEPIGSIIAQTPEAGKRIKEGSPVNVTLAGPPPATVPALLGMDAPAATSALAEVGLILGDATEEFDPTAPVGTIVEQIPIAGGLLNQGLPVAVIISKGPEPVPIPAVVGKSEAEATQLLVAAGFEVAVTRVDNKAPKGTVIAITPAEATALPGAKITLTISTGVELVKVPNVLGLGLDEASNRLRGAGLQVKELYFHGPGDSDSFSQPMSSVYRQTPKAGATVPKGTTVEIRAWWEAS